MQPRQDRQRCTFERRRQQFNVRGLHMPSLLPAVVPGWRAEYEMHRRQSQYVVDHSLRSPHLELTTLITAQVACEMDLSI